MIFTLDNFSNEELVELCIQSLTLLIDRLPKEERIALVEKHLDNTIFELGSLNKTTATVRERISELFYDIAEDLRANYDQLSPEAKLNFVAKILPYLAPKLEAVSEIEKDDHVIIVNRTIVQGGGLGEVFGEHVTPEDFMRHALSTTVGTQQTTT